VFIFYENIHTRTLENPPCGGVSGRDFPPCGVKGVNPPIWGVGGQAIPQRGFRGSLPLWGFRGENPEGKISL